ncbi:hypothetical protein R3P38DRAFT_3187262 [Favolaschia claudopus]|uniref:Uncharacterized protein n=1 Tax=Favolaschia claudopus TaxID=2862362 RepID=A0AAW0BXF1_9AGAR
MLPDLLHHIDPIDKIPDFEDFPPFRGLDVKTPNLIDVLIEDFSSSGQDYLWRMFIDSIFCRAMAFSRNRVEPSFREYATQGWVFSWEFLRYIALQAAIAPDIPTVAEQALRVAEQNLAVRNRKVLISDYLDVPGPTLYKAKPHATVSSYISFLKEEVCRPDQSEKGDTFFDMHVLAIPSIVGHHLIAKKLLKMSGVGRRPLNKAFKKIYIDTHISNVCTNHLYSYFERNSSKYVTAHPIRLATWTRAFRTALELEIKLFMTYPFPPILFEMLCDFANDSECTHPLCPRHTALTDVIMDSVTGDLGALGGRRTSGLKFKDTVSSDLSERLTTSLSLA